MGAQHRERVGGLPMQAQPLEVQVLRTVWRRLLLAAADRIGCACDVGMPRLGAWWRLVRAKFNNFANCWLYDIL
jgi:hypothetical protein